MKGFRGQFPKPSRLRLDTFAQVRVRHQGRSAVARRAERREGELNGAARGGGDGRRDPVREGAGRPRPAPGGVRDRAVLVPVLHGLRHRRHPRLRPHAHGRDAARRGQVQHAGQLGQVPFHRDWLRDRDARGGHAGPRARLVPHPARVLGPGRVQVRLLRVLQEDVRRHGGPGDDAQVPVDHLPGRVRVRRVHRRHRPGALRGHQGQGADHAGVRQGAHGRHAQVRGAGGHGGAVPGPGGAVGPPDPLHDDEVWGVREHGAAAVPHGGAQAQERVHQDGAAGCLLPGRLHRGRAMRRGQPAGRQPRVQAQLAEGVHGRRHRARDGVVQPLHPRPRPPHRHGRHPHRHAVGHLRRLQGIRGAPHHGRGPAGRPRRRPCKGGRAGSEEELTRALGQTGQTVLK